MLLVAELADVLYAVAVFGRALELQIFRRLNHLLLQQPEQAAVIAAQQMRGLLVALAQLRRRDRAGAADAYALPDVEIQAGAALADVLRELLMAARQSQRLAHRADDAVRRRVRRKRPVVLRAVAVVAGGHGQSGILALRELDIGVALRVLELDVVVRHVLLDERVLQHQRLQLGGGVIDLEAVDGGDHFGRLARRNAARREIAGNAVLQRLRFADVDDAVELVAHDVHARRRRQQSGLCQQLGFFHALPPLKTQNVRTHLR